MKKISIKKAIYILVAIAIIGVVVISVIAKGSKELFEYTTQTLEKSDLTQTVSETGVIKTSKSFDLSFEQGGTISKIYTSIGQVVQKDQLLAELDYSNLDIRLNQARASLDVAKANLSKLQSGATVHEIAIYTANYNRAKASYDSALIDLQKYKVTLNENITQAQKTLDDLVSKDINTITTYEQALDSAVTNLENTKTTYQKGIDNSLSTSLTSAEAQTSPINNSLDQVNSIITDTDIDEFLSVKNKVYLTQSKRAYDEAIILLERVNEDILLVKISPNKDNVSDLLSSILNTLNKTYLSLNNLFSALENSVTSSSYTKTQLDAHKAIINTQIGIISASLASIQSSSQALDSAILTYDTKVDTANDGLSQAKANYDNALITATNNLANTINSGEQQISTIQSQIDIANNSLLVTQAELNRIKSPARYEDVNLYQAQVRQAESELSSIKNQIEKTKLKSPIAGTVSKLDIEPGEQYNIGRPMLSIISGNEYEIEVDISESDITKVKIGDKTLITLDALGTGLKFYGTVSFIEPAETVIQEVIYYRVTVVFDANNGNLNLVKPGMTADVEITTNSKTNILFVPGRAIIDRNGDGKFVKTYNNQIVEEKKVQTGIFGNGGLVEIISGLSEGDEVITFSKEK